MLVYDVTCRDSFRHMHGWARRVRKVSGPCPALANPLPERRSAACVGGTPWSWPTASARALGPHFASQRPQEAPEAAIVLVGNKIDLGTKRTVTTEMGHEMATQFKVRLFETSAMTCAGVTEAFAHLAQVAEAAAVPSLPPTKSCEGHVDLAGPPQKASACCT